MNKLFLSLFLLVCTINFVGCLDITEELSMQNDGSGHYLNTIDAVKMSEQMSMFASMDSTGEMIPKMKYSMDSGFIANGESAKKIAGISNYKIDTSKAWVYIISFDFKNVDALNKAIGIGKSSTQQDVYAWEKGKITRKDIPLSIADMNMDDPSQKEMMKGFMADMKYKVIFNVPSKVKDASNKSFVMSSDKKSVKIDCSFLDVVEGKIKLSNTVVYK
jgi:hypothetical protein